MSETVTVLGRPSTQPPRDDLDRLYDDVRYEVVDEVVAVSAREAAAEVSLDAEPDDVLEIEDTDGLVTFTRVDSALEDVPPATRAATPEVVTEHIATRDGLGRIAKIRRAKLTLPEDIAAAAQTLHENLKDAVLDRATRRLLDPAVTKAAKKIAAWVDEPAKEGDPNWHTKPKTRGMYRIAPDLRLSASDLVGEEDLSTAAEPFLLLLHGTFSHTEAGFGGIRGLDFSRFARAYDDRILALEHATLSETPAENALQAATILPEGARLHIISHSRGGLIGEALSLAAAAAWPGTTLYRQRDQGDHPDVEALHQLTDLVRDKGITVERFARVACPAQGTILASRRLDRYASYLFNAFNLIPAVRETGIPAIIKRLLLAVLDKRSDPHLVPGIEAMMPDSAFVALLSTAGSIDDGMAAIAGDVQASGLWDRLKVLGADLFYREDHDFVVHTRAMAGGVPRKTRRQAFYRGPEVVHSTYFARTATRRAVIRWLQADSYDVDEFAEPGGRPILSRAQSGPATPLGTVVFVPDVFGSVLDRNGQAVWPVVRQLVAGVEQALPSEGRVDVRDPSGAYEPLMEHLGLRFTVTPYAYDWRQPVATTTPELVARLRVTLDEATHPVHVVATGAGALRVLAAYQRDPALSRRINASGGRTLLISPPVEGSWRMASILSGHHELPARMALIDPTGTARDVGAVLAKLPGLSELLPQGGPFQENALDAGRTLRKAIQTDGAGCIVLFGSGAVTVEGWSAEAGRYTTSTAGDGYTIGRPAAFPAATVRYAKQPYASLLSEPPGLAHISDLLVAGASSGLLATAPASAVERGHLRPAEQRVEFPTDTDLVESALEIAPRAPARRDDPVLLSVVHGDLRYVTASLMVGFYDGTPIGGAGDVLDRMLDRALSNRLALGQLAGPLGTVDVISRKDAGPAVIIGMGDPGELSASELTAGVTKGILRLALEHQESGSSTEDPAMTVATALIGAGSSGGLTVPVSLSAIVNGVHRANRSLSDAGQSVRVEALQVVEVYEDRAIEAATAAIELAERPQPNGAVIVAEQILLDGCGRRPGQPPPDYRTDEWRTIRVVAAPDARRRHDELVDLSFTSVGRSARAEQRVNTAQRRIISTLVEQSVADSSADPQLYNTLYELLVPLSLKNQGPDRDHLLFVLDEHASTLPLELLGTKSWTGEPTPLAVETGLLRRLETPVFREVVRPATGHRALVIGDPAIRNADGSQPAPRLPGAREEARRVAEALRSYGYEVTALISEDDKDQSVNVSRVMNALFAHDYRIIHIAAHGLFESVERNGILLNDGILLTANEVRQMQATPDLVFLNACHAGSILLRSQLDPDVDRTEAGGDARSAPVNAPVQLAASIARQLINDGVRAVVAAGWAVDDAAAATFATEFYGQLLDKEDLGTAAHEARATIHRRYPHVNTWGAYQIYGPPAMRIHTAASDHAREPMIVSRKQFHERLAALQRQAENAKDQTIQHTWTSVSELQSVVPSHWRGGDELAREADIAFALGRYDDAIKRYEDARAKWDSRTPLKAIEQLANAYVKRAQQLRESAASSEPGANGDPHHDAERYEKIADKLIEGVLAIGGETPERLAMKGSYWRRRAAALADPSEALLQARDAYHAAAKLHREKFGTLDFYTGLNYLLLEWLVAVRTGKTVDDAAAALQDIEDCLSDTTSRKCPDFWSRAAEGDALLLKALIERAVADRQAEIAAAYLRAATNGASRRERLTIIEHIAIICRALETVNEPPREEIIATLRALADALHPDGNASAATQSVP